jgi:osmotically-inducible protein OsmY
MNLSSTKTFLFLILAISVVRPHTLVAADRPSGETIRYWVKDAISEDLYMDASEIAVDVSDGIVTLSGTVKNLTMKKYATKEAKKIRGVLGVIDKLTVMPSYRGDEEIAQDVRRRIVHSAAIESKDVHVSCTRGTIELTGKVASWSEREEADLLAGEVRGVKDVQNYLSLDWTAKRSDEAIWKDVIATLHRNVYLADLPIDVSVEDGIKVNVRKGGATLTGTVYNWGERKEAERVVLNTHGVRFVDNRLHVKGYDYPYEDWKIPDPNAPPWTYHDVDPYGS